MIGLIRKDLYYLASSWKPLLLSVFIIGGFSTWKGFGAILIVILPTFFGLSIMGCIQMDAQNKWYDYYRVLPISFRNVVAARYFAYLAFTGIGFLITVVYGYVIQFTMGITALGTRFAMWQGFSMGIALALSLWLSYSCHLLQQGRENEVIHDDEWFLYPLFYILPASC